MKTNSRCATQSVFVISFVLFASLILFTGHVMAQKPAANDAALADALYLCMRFKFPNVRRDILDPSQAIDQSTGRSFFWDKDKGGWRDAKTGECVCPKCAEDPQKTPAQSEDALYLCLRFRFPNVRRDVLDPSQAIDQSTSRSFFWDKDKKAWRDAKTGECICPKCAPENTTPPPPKGDCLKAKYPHVEFILGGEVAMDRDSNHTFVWDDDKKAWVDFKTGECVCPKCGPGPTTIPQINSRNPPKDNCLTAKYPHVEFILGGEVAMDRDSNHTFVFDDAKHAWVEFRTGECICPNCPEPTTIPQINSRKPKVEVSFGYLFMHAPAETVKNLNGFDASLFYNIKKISIGGEVSGGFGSTTDTIGTTRIDTSLKRYMYLFGPRFKVYENDKARVFVHSLFGGVHDTTKITVGTTSTSFSANAFAMAFGGGLDVKLNNRFAIRPIQFDYVLTHFGNQFQNNYEFSTGVVFTLGNK
jgi:nitrite reductase/ring-hydroxylating ferredoxin subunit